METVIGAEGQKVAKLSPEEQLLVGSEIGRLSKEMLFALESVLHTYVCAQPHPEADLIGSWAIVIAVIMFGIKLEKSVDRKDMEWCCSVAQDLVKANAIHGSAFTH